MRSEQNLGVEVEARERRNAALPLHTEWDLMWKHLPSTNSVQQNLLHITIFIGNIKAKV